MTWPHGKEWSAIPVEQDKHDQVVSVSPKPTAPSTITSHPSKQKVTEKDGAAETTTTSFIPRRWTSPSIMISCFLLGVLLAVGHHIYYGWLDDQAVGSLARQQWSLRLGNLFAVATAASLKIAMGDACIQYVWLRLRQRHHNLKTIDDAFSMTGDLLPFFHLDLYKRMSIGVVLALLIWAIPVAALFPPATLSVVLDTNFSLSEFDVLQASISAPNPANQYGIDPSDTFNTSYKEPTQVFPTLVKSIAYAGQANAPLALVSASNYSYVLHTDMPRFKCSDNPDDVDDWVVDVAEESMSNLTDTTRTFDRTTFTYVSNAFAENGIPDKGAGVLFYIGVGRLDAAKLEDDDGLLGVVTPKTKALLETFPLAEPDQLLRSPLRDAVGGPIYIAMLTEPGRVKLTTCSLYNSTFETETSFDAGIGSTRVVSITDHAAIRDFSLNSSTPTSYLHYFREMADLLVGAMVGEDTVESFNDSDPTVFRMPLSSVPIETTVLAQAEDFARLLQYRAAWLDDTEFKAQPAQNKSLATMMTELSVNVSLSLMSSPSLSRTVSVTGEIYTLSTVYRYQPTNLLISYGVAIACSLASIIVGMVAFIQNGDSHDAKISTIGAMMQNPDLAPHLRRTSSLPGTKIETRSTGTASEGQDPRSLRLRLGTYTLAEGSDPDQANPSDPGMRRPRFVGFVTDRGLGDDGVDRDVELEMYHTTTRR